MDNTEMLLSEWGVPDEFIVNFKIDGREFTADQLLQTERQEESPEEIQRRSVPTTPTQPLILEYSEKNVKSLQEPVKTPATPKALGSSGAIEKTKIINKNDGKVITRSTNERRN
ncbi:hypothetical protein JTB14_008775 [Gonioctena quinquepunctata]|nr:hypothetical protein JTB14_008775 [Gonioctena quinquepunctata]